MNLRLHFFFTTLILSVLFGEINFAQSSITDTTFDAGNVDTTLTQSVDYKSNPGFLQLETGERENLAKNRFAYIVYKANPPLDTSRTRGERLIDANFSTYIEIPSRVTGGDNSNSYIIIDLQAFRTIKRVKLYTFVNNPNLRPLGFSVYAGEDTITMEKVFENLNNEETQPEANFNPLVARYVKIVINIIGQLSTTVLSEIEVYGEGFLPEGIFTSDVKTLTKNVNFSTYEFTGNIPEGTDAEFAFRTGSTPLVDSTWSPWSDYNSVSSSLFSVYEPRSFIQYRVRLATNNLQTPLIDEIKINYDTLLIASSTDAFVSPQFVTILKENQFTLSINTSFSESDRGIDTLTIQTPSPINLLNVQVNSVNASYLSNVGANTVSIAFNQTIKTNSRIDIIFKTTPFLGVSPYFITASSKGAAYNPQRIDSKVSDNIEGWSIVTVGVPERLIINASAEPNPFTPNGDGKNDETEIKFFLGNVGEPNSLIGQQVRDLKIKIFDLTGRMIKELFNSQTKAFAFVSSNAIKWDGKDENGNVVRPGVYIYQIFIDSDNGGEYESRTVVVSY